MHLFCYYIQVAVIHDTPEYRLAVARNAIVDNGKPKQTWALSVRSLLLRLSPRSPFSLHFFFFVVFFFISCPSMLKIKRSAAFILQNIPMKHFPKCTRR